MVNKLKLIEELEQIRMRITKIYMELGNPNNCFVDSRLNDEIEIFRNNKELTSNEKKVQ